MAKIYYQEDCDLSILQDKKIAVICNGIQGHAHALNLKERQMCIRDRHDYY